MKGASSTYTLTVEYSTDLENWNNAGSYSTDGEISFVAPADDCYYLRFTGRYVYLSNFVGFKLGSKEIEIVSVEMPTTTTFVADANNAVGFTRYLANDYSFTPVLVIVADFDFSSMM